MSHSGANYPALAHQWHLWRDLCFLKEARKQGGQDKGREVRCPSRPVGALIFKAFGHRPAMCRNWARCGMRTKTGLFGLLAAMCVDPCHG